MIDQGDLAVLSDVQDSEEFIGTLQRYLLSVRISAFHRKVFFHQHKVTFHNYPRLFEPRKIFHTVEAVMCMHFGHIKTV